MTTIAYSAKHRMIAADRLISSGERIVGYTSQPKIKQVGSYIFGGAGDADSLLKFFDSLDDIEDFASPTYVIEYFKEIMDPDRGVDLIAVNTKKPKEIVLMSTIEEASLSTGVPVEGLNGMATCGSGGPYALGAMMYGADPKEAVRIASAVDIRSGGRIDVIKF